MLKGILMAFVMINSYKIVLFQENLGHVAEEREIELKRGEVTLNLKGIPRNIFLESFDIFSKRGKIDLISARWLYELKPDEILKKSLGKTVTLIDEETNITYTLIGYDGEFIYLRDGENRIRLLKRKRISSLLFPEPEKLIKEPVLTVKVKSAKGGKTPVTISYITSGLSWKARYDAILNDKILMLKGSALLENKTDKDYPESEISLFAGRLEIPQRIMTLERVEKGAVAEPVKFGEDFFRFSLPGKWDLMRGSKTKAIFLDETLKNFEKDYVFEAQRWRAGKVRIRVKSKNETDAPLPPGEVYLYAVEKGTPRLVHLSRIDLIPVGGKIELDFGPAEELEAERKEISRKRITQKEYRVEVEIEIRNGKRESVEVKVVEHPGANQWEITESNFPYKKIDVNTVEFSVRVPPQGKETLRITYRLIY
jgi:hypothetical protein